VVRGRRRGAPHACELAGGWAGGVGSMHKQHLSVHPSIDPSRSAVTAHAPPVEGGVAWRQGGWAGASGSPSPPQVAARRHSGKTTAAAAAATSSKQASGNPHRRRRRRRHRRRSCLAGRSRAAPARVIRCRRRRCRRRLSAVRKDVNRDARPLLAVDGDLREPRRCVEVLPVGLEVQPRQRHGLHHLHDGSGAHARRR